MEATSTSEGHQLLITGAAGEQPLIMSAEDAAQFLAQAGLQLSDIGDSERIIIGEARPDQHEGSIIEGNGVMTAESLLAASAGIDVGGDVTGELNDGTVLYIDPNDPQAAALLQQAGLTVAEDGTVHSIEDVAGKMGGFENGNNGAALAQEFFAPQQQQQQQQQQHQMLTKKESLSIVPDVIKGTEFVDAGEFMDASGLSDHHRTANALEEASTLAALATAAAPPQQPIMTTATSTIASAQPQPTARAQTTSLPASSIHVGPDQQQVFYSVTGEDGKMQQYMMLCPKDMDQTTLIQTLVRQISSDPTSRGKKTIRITQQKRTTTPAARPPRVVAGPRATQAPRVRRPVVTPASAVGSPMGGPRAPLSHSTPAKPPPAAPVAARKMDMLSQATAGLTSPGSNTLDTSGAFEIVQQQQQQFVTADNVLEMAEALAGIPTENRVCVRCNYCTGFTSPLNSDTWEGILNHILPVCKEELQTTFYGDLNKHFIRSVRIQVNGKAIDPTDQMPQCEVILTHSLVCRKTKREFIINKPDANFIANLAKHIRMTQPGQGGRGNSLLCIFCNSPFTYEDYLRHIQPHLEAILATLSCFAGAYCVGSYEQLRATTTCSACQEPEAADLRFLPCTKFSTEYHCLTKLQFGIECFREHYSDNGFMRLNTNHMAKCTVCKNPQQVYCAVFHITSTVMGTGDELGQQQNVDSQLAVCVNCQKQFINIVIKEQGFEDRMKLYQLRNMEQLCSCLRVILGQVKNICSEKRVLIYSVHENTSNANSTVHTVKGADITEAEPVTKLLALPETEIAASPVKAFFVCDLCVFTVDLTSLIATPTNRQKNDMLLSIVLEHVVPHTDSLMNLIASSASQRTFSLKFEISSNVTDQGNIGQRKIVLSLRKKLHSQLGNAAEVIIDKDNETTINAIRAAVKSERKSYVSVRGGPGTKPGEMAADTPPTLTTTTSASSSQQAEINKFIEKYKGRFNIWSQCGCNTSLLNSYMECRLCSKFCFPDFRLGSTCIEMCENCVETVLTLCLPSEPECLEMGEECLALKDERTVGHRLVLASDVKKWLSLDGVNLIKRTVEEFERVRASDCSTAFSDGVRQHLLAALKTCQNDADITTAVAGFCVTDDFLNPHGLAANNETAAALASLQEQAGVPIRAAEEKKRERQIEVKILARRPAHSTKKTPIPIRFGGNKITATPTYKRVIKNGTVIDLGTPSSASSSTTAPSQAKVIFLNSSRKTDEEESVSAIQSFLEETSPDNKTTTTIIDGREVRVPAGIKITSAGKGVVNIRAVTDARPTVGVKPTGRAPMAISAASAIAAAKSAAARGGAKMVTLTAGGIIKRASEATSSMSEDDDVDSDMFDDDDDDLDDDHHTRVAPAKRRPGRPGRPKASVVGGDDDDKDYRPPAHVGGSGARGRPKKIPIIKRDPLEDEASLPEDESVASTTADLTAASAGDSSAASMDDSTVSTPGGSEEPRSKRARKEKKIFDL